ncbi:XRCC4-like factor-domain-containing protein [Chaetomidium leptoderma]|uniref:Non-homologous end-joining factor 1 n=1 Tax=Chaetomidium leptoderma TaxID=669021 RepID=A0AAN6VNP3_9PEZI|nr:XRCC4-like factor-domain-containing protein [Chaetomidium leptoderma]
MSGHPSWRLLPATASGIPTLLVSTAFSADSYSVHLSDLANVWVESLDRRPIIKRGMVEDTSIDPSDGPDQIRRMLELLRAAFDSSDSEHANTSLTLSRDDDGDSLVVHVTCVLPKPLKPFKWPLHLRKCPQSTIASELVLPMVQAHEARTHEIGQLISLLREKDAVIARLIDKLEATGTGLEHVFNALSGKRKVTRTTAEGRVKGLAPFSESGFRSEAADPRPATQSPDISALMGAVFGPAGLQYKSGSELEASTMLNDWWTKLAKGRSVILSERPEGNECQTASAPPEPEPSKEEDDDFQVQATPTRARSTHKRGGPPQTVDEDETSDGEDAPEAAAPSPSPPKAKAGSGSRFGAIGRNKRPSPSPPPPTMSQRSTSTKTAAADTQSKSASEADGNDLANSPPPSPPKPAPRRGGLGRIGGNSKPETLATRPTRSPSPSAPPEESSQLPRRHKLGMIGKKASSPEPPTTSASDGTRGRSKTPASEPKKEQVRETSQERADRKRAELQREIEKRAAAGPAKKKRRF